MLDTVKGKNRVIERKDGILELEVLNLPDIFPQIPNQYGIIGSGARQLLELELGLISSYSSLRDFDIVRFGDEEYEGQDISLAKEYMPDDFLHGNGVSRMTDDYFKTRDFTMNEVYYHNGKLAFTKRCLDDLNNQRIKLTEDTFNEDYGNHDFKNVIKALRVYVERKDNFPRSEIFFMNKKQLEDSYCSLFWIALNLDKAYFSGVADKFLSLLQELGFLPVYLQSPEEARKYIEDSGEVHHFGFKYLERDYLTEAMLVELLDDYEYERYVVGDRVLEILDGLHPHESSSRKKWKRR